MSATCSQNDQKRSSDNGEEGEEMVNVSDGRIWFKKLREFFVVFLQLFCKFWNYFPKKKQLKNYS